MIRTLLASAVFAVAFAVSASAATVTYTDPLLPIDGYATGITYDDAALRGSANGRDNAANALGNTPGDFFEIGYGSTVDLTFGTLFTSPGSTVEVTNGSRSGWLESVRIFVGTAGGAFFEITGSPFTNAAATLNFSFTGGPFDTLRFVDTSPVRPGTTTGGWDIASVRVTPIPLPAGGLLLLGGLAGLAGLRRRKPV